MQFSQLYTQASNSSLTQNVVLAKQAVNDAYAEAVLWVNLNPVDTGYVALTGGTSKYSLATLFSLSTYPASIKFMFYQGTGQSPIYYEMVPESVQRVLELTGNGTIVGNVKLYAVDGADTLYLYPTPATGDTLRMIYSASPTALSADSDVPVSLPTHMHYMIVFGAARNLAIVNDPDTVPKFDAIWQKALIALQAWSNSRKGLRPTQARIGYPRSRVYHDRSTYFTGQ